MYEIHRRDKSLLEHGLVMDFLYPNLMCDDMHADVLWLRRVIAMVMTAFTYILVYAGSVT